MSANDDSDEVLAHSVSLDAKAGEVVQVSPLVRRVIAPNPGPFTFTGTCGYIVGRGAVAIIDPGPDDPAHVETLLQALSGETVSAIVVTHTHRDHSPASRALSARTGAPIIGCAPFVPRPGPMSGLDSAHDLDYRPDRAMADGDIFSGLNFSLVAVATPGHAANHLAFALPEERALFSGDHVMAWSTSIVTPPDGSMSDYMDSLDKLRRRDDVIFWPGHGGPVMQPQRYMRALAHHRRQREAAILARLSAGDEAIAVMVERIYEGLDPRLKNAAALSIFAHIEDLIFRDLVVTKDGTKASIDSLYRAKPVTY